MHNEGDGGVVLALCMSLPVADLDPTDPKSGQLLGRLTARVTTSGRYSSWIYNYTLYTGIGPGCEEDRYFFSGSGGGWGVKGALLVNTNSARARLHCRAWVAAKAGIQVELAAQAITVVRRHEVCDANRAPIPGAEAAPVQSVNLRVGKKVADALDIDNAPPALGVLECEMREGLRRLAHAQRRSSGS